MLFMVLARLSNHLSFWSGPCCLSFALPLTFMGLHYCTIITIHAFQSSLSAFNRLPLHKSSLIISEEGIKRFFLWFMYIEFFFLISYFFKIFLQFSGLLSPSVIGFFLSVLNQVVVFAFCIN